MSFSIVRHTTHATPNTETSVLIPTNITGFSMIGALGQTDTVKFAFQAGEITAGNFGSLTNGKGYTAEPLPSIISGSIFFESTVASRVIEIIFRP